MKKNRIAASGCLLLLAVTFRAEANFYVPSHQAQSCQRKPASPPAEAGWQTPNIKEETTPCATSPKSSSAGKQCCPFTPVPVSQNVAGTPSVPPPTRFNSPRYQAPLHKDEVVVIVYEGSLKTNVERILRENCWDRVIWKPNVDYRWVGTAKIAGPDLATVMSTLLSPFPLEVTFYHANHVAAINVRKYHE
ncbi:MAG: hypothetical protein HY939_01955 [Gammaproteobacteria bacterium]|nr:hypothetical protein [Gammaproteobacteria bacterium]